MRLAEEPPDERHVDPVDHLVGGCQPLVGKRAPEGNAAHARTARGCDPCLRVLERNRFE